MSGELKELKFDTNKVFAFRVANNDTRSVNISAFSGVVQLTIWDRNQSGGPVEKIAITSSLKRLFIRQMTELLSAQPNTVLTLEQKTWMRNSDGKGGSFQTRAIFKFIKDEKQTYAFEISTPKMVNPVKCVFRSVDKFVIGNEEITESESSALGVHDFLDFLKIDYTFAKHHSKFNLPKIQRNYKAPAPNSNEPSYTNGSEDVY